MTKPTAAANAAGLPEEIAAWSYAGSDQIEWVCLAPLPAEFSEPCRAAIALAGGQAFLADLTPTERSVRGTFCQAGSVEQAIEVDGGAWCFARRHIGSVVRLIGRVVDSAEVRS